MILLARIEDIRTTAGGGLLVTASYWIDASPTISGNVSFPCDVQDAGEIRVRVIAACELQAATDFGVSPDSLTNTSVV